MLRRFIPCFAALAVIVPIACISADPGLPVTCDEYCSVVQNKCTGVNAQYRNGDECKKVCGLFELGSFNDGDTGTIGCRLRKAREANDKPSCAAAGPYGGDVCGDRCEAYCTIADRECISDPAVNAALHPFESKGDCSEACPNFRVEPAEDGPPNTKDGADTFNCRARHLIIAIDDPSPHCEHAGRVSRVCGGDASGLPAGNDGGTGARNGNGSSTDAGPQQ